VRVSLLPVGWYAEADVPTARAFAAMAVAAAADGVELRVSNGFRSHEDQIRLYQAWKNGWGEKAAKPGHSKHQLGRALDLQVRRAGAWDWLEANARRFGFKRTVASEPWHWELVGKPRKRT